jgi:hypothetical protein
MFKWYEHSEINLIRVYVEDRLDLSGYPPPKGEDETATGFWARVEKAGMLPKALALYDELAAQHKAWMAVRRETKEEFAARVAREGRGADAEQLQAKLLGSGMSQRKAQVELVRRLQPLDGSHTRAWETPDPWEAGRLFRKNADHERLKAQAYPQDEDDEREQEVAQARRRIECAQWRREERVALAAARRRSQALKEASAPHSAGPATPVGVC